MNKEEFNELYETLKKSKFKQQKYPGWRPLPTISCITIIFLSFGVFFILMGIFILIFISQLKEFKFRYDELCYDYMNENHTISFTVPEKMKRPIMIYYQLNDFRQNHRFYMDNKSSKQLKGEEVSKEDLEKSGECEGAITNSQMGINFLGQEDDVAFPCGLIAKSFFSDRFLEWKISGKEVNITTENIAYKKDIDDFSKVAFDEEKHWQNINDEHFMIWSRINPFENPKKLYGKIENNDIEKGSNIEITVENNYYFNFEKYIILSTRNVFGGKNSFLGICYIVFGALCLISAIIFINVYNAIHKNKKQ